MAPRPAPVEAPAPPDRADEVAATALRRYLLQLLPCDRDAGDLELVVSLGDDGRVRDVQPGASSVPPETARCVASRLPWWRFADLRPAARELRLSLTFPLQPPSLQDYVPVLSSAGRVDLGAAGRELHRLRPKVLGCYHDRKAESMILLWVRLGPWGRLLGHGVEADSGEATVPKAARDRERACLRRVLRFGEFPNPEGGDVELRYPYVLAR